MPEYVVTELGVVRDVQQLVEAADEGIALQGEAAFFVDADGVAWRVTGLWFHSSGWCRVEVGEA